MLNTFNIFINQLNENFENYLIDWFEMHNHEYEYIIVKQRNNKYGLFKYNKDTDRHEDSEWTTIDLETKKLYKNKVECGDILDIYQLRYGKASLYDSMVELAKKYKLQHLLTDLEINSNDTEVDKEIKTILQKITKGKRKGVYTYVSDNKVFTVNFVYAIKNNEVDTNEIVGILQIYTGLENKSIITKVSKKDKVKRLYFSNTNTKGVVFLERNKTDKKKSTSITEDKHALAMMETLENELYIIEELNAENVKDLPIDSNKKYTFIFTEKGLNCINAVDYLKRCEYNNGNLYYLTPVKRQIVKSEEDLVRLIKSNGIIKKITSEKSVDKFLNCYVDFITRFDNDVEFRKKIFDNLKRKLLEN